MIREDLILFGVQIRVLQGRAKLPPSIFPNGLPANGKHEIDHQDGWQYVEHIFSSENSSGATSIELAQLAFRQHQIHTLGQMILMEPDPSNKPDGPQKFIVTHQKAKCELRLMSYLPSEIIEHTDRMCGCKVYTNAHDHDYAHVRD